jgi:glucosamine 6-phosphate synthetase-like amidotransferase/phosphosugar isomerase protein
MCGLAGFIIKDTRVLNADRAEALLDALLLQVDHRGGDATGVVALTDDAATTWLIKASCDAKDYVAGRPALPEGARVVIGHTRFATQGDAAFPFNNHPVRVGETYVTHNGHIWNDKEIEKKTRPYMHAVDSASIGAALDMTVWASTDAIRKALEMLEGGAAVVACSPIHAPGRVLIARVSDSPLYVWEGRSAIVWASTQSAVRAAWASAVGKPPACEKVVALKEGDGLLVDEVGEVERFTFEPPWSYQPQHYTQGTPMITTAEWVEEWDHEEAWRDAWKTHAPASKKVEQAAKQILARSIPAKPTALVVAPTVAQAIPYLTPRGYECDGCQDVYVTRDDLADWGVGFYCLSCVAFAEDTGKVPGYFGELTA